MSAPHKQRTGTRGERFESEDYGVASASSAKESTLRSRRPTSPGGVHANSLVPSRHPAERNYDDNPISLDTALIYEDFNTGLRAEQVLESVERLYPGQLTFKLAAWRFDVLRESAVFEIALHDASRAVIVLLSAHGRGGLPEAVDLWLQQWLDWKKDEPCALAISLDESRRVSDASFQIVSSLQERARAKNVAIFHHFILPRRIESRSTTQTVQRRPHASTATLDHHQHWTEPHLDWGINE